MGVEASIPGRTPPVFTPEQISAVLAILEKDPDLVRKIVSSGEGGNEEDLVLMLESGKAFWTTVEKNCRHIT